MNEDNVGTETTTRAHSRNVLQRQVATVTTRVLTATARLYM